MVEKKGRPPGKNGKKNNSIFNVFTADMVEKRGRPLGKKGKNRKQFDVYRFYRGYGREKRGAPPVKMVKKEKLRFLPVLPRIW